MMRVLFLAASIVFLSGCSNGNAGGGAGEQFDSSGYAVEEIPGIPFQRVTKRNPDNNNALQEEGLLRNGLREGTWVIYHMGGQFPEQVISYANGLYNGPYMEFNDRGQMTLRATYKNNVLDGPWGKYRFGRAEAEAFYKDGKYDGPYREYDSQSGKVLKEVNYKDGLQHGTLRFYNDQGEVTLEYEYRNGEKVSGGIVGNE